MKKRYRLVRGTHRIANTQYHPGDILFLREEEADKIREKIEPVSESREPNPGREEVQAAPAKPALGMEHRGGGRYLVYDKITGEYKTEDYVSREEAEAMVEGE